MVECIDKEGIGGLGGVVPLTEWRQGRSIEVKT